MKLSVIVPVYNEKNTIEVIIQKLLTVPINKEIIIVDDGSTDGTSQILKKISQQKFPLIKVIFQPKNIGKGYAIRRAINEITGDVVVI
ncbi:MAG TPA: glycosyltransferase family 2 protein, partial [bacterium]|nr:glycosyltransferase family 2 protein [bacterium]